MTHLKRHAGTIFISITLPVAITALGWAMQAGEYKAQLEQNTHSIEEVKNADQTSRDVLWKNVATYRDMTITHEAVLTRLEKKVDNMDAKIDQLLQRRDS